MSITNPRQIRALCALLDGPQTVRSLVAAAGANNAPDIVARLRKRGLAIPCVEIKVLDRDGRRCTIGQYYLTADDRQKAREWLAGGRQCG